jgi:hypothetical protein
MDHQRNRTLTRFRRLPGAQHQQVRVEGMAKEQNWPGTLMALGIFAAVFSFWLAGSFTFITYSELGRWFALFAFAGNLIPFRASGLRMGMERLEWFLFNLLAVGPFLFSFCLWLNMGVHGPERYMLVRADPEFDVRRYWLEHDELPAHTVLENSAEQDGLIPPDGQILGIAKGCLGYEVITTWEAAEIDVLERLELEILLQLEGESFSDQPGLAHHSALGTQ